MVHKVAVIIPVKEHSERVPGKNFRLFGGVPLYQVIVNTLLQCAFVEHIYIDTDSQKILTSSVFKGKRVTVFERSRELIGDMVSVNKIIAYNVARITSRYFLQTHCTNPLLGQKTVDAAIQLYFDNSNQYDSLFSVTRYNSRFYDADFCPLNHKPEELLRTQDLLPLYEENSNLYIFSRESFFENKEKRIGRKPYLFTMNKIEAIDIDTEDDFILAETLYSRVCEQKGLG